MQRNYILILLVFFIFNSCTPSTVSNKIRIATLKGPSAMGMVKMIDSINRTKNASIEISVYNEPIQVRKLMLEGNVDFAILPTTMGSILYNKGIQYQVAAIPVWGTLYLFGNDTTINSWDDLKGKRIHVMAKGMTPDILFKHLLVKNGIDPELDVQLDYSFPTHIDLANAVTSGQANLAVISEPLVSMVMQNNKMIHPIFDLNKEWKKVNENIPIAQTALLVKTEFASKNAKDVEKILSSYQASSDWVNQNPEKAALLIVKYNILPNTEVALSSIPRSNLEFVKATQVKTQIFEYLKIFHELNPEIIGGKLPDENFIYDHLH